MSCPTCEGTMQAVANAGGDDSVFWCPRCGTIRMRALARDDIDHAPDLVSRSRDLLVMHDDAVFICGDDDEPRVHGALESLREAVTIADEDEERPAKRYLRDSEKCVHGVKVGERCDKCHEDDRWRDPNAWTCGACGCENRSEWNHCGECGATQT